MSAAPATLPAADVTCLLLVRAVEEADPEAVSPEARGDAAIDAGGVDPPEQWLVRRARLLLRRLPPPYPRLADMLERTGRIGRRLVLAGAFLVGLAANYVGPSDHIHVLYNPLAALVVWNLAVYLTLAVLHLRRRPRPPSPVPPHVAGTPTASTAQNAVPSRGWHLLEWALPVLVGLQHRLERGREAARGEVVRATRVAAVARRFLVLGYAVAGDRARTVLHATLHLGAIALSVGALAGTYVRGVFLEYAVVWRSTFVRDGTLVRTILDLVLGPASVLLRGHGFRPEEIAGLQSPDGLPAAPYLHMLALTAVLAIVVPRAVLASFAVLRMRAQRLPVDLTDGYYARLVEQARALQLEELTEPLKLELKIESAKLAEAIAVFVRDQLYDARIVSELRRFRDEGGRVVDLEATLAATCAAFAPQLERFVRSAHEDFVRALAVRAARLLGSEASRHTMLAGGLTLDPLASAGAGGSAGALGAELTGAVTVAVSTAVALAAGTVSGGLGHSLGIAIVSTLLHTTGPVGFLIGALTAFAVTAGLLDVSRDTVGEWTKSLPIPAAGLRVLLRDSRLESLAAQGRAQAYASVKERVQADLTAAEPALLEQLLAGLQPVLRRLATERRA